MIKKILTVMSYHESSLTSLVLIEVCRQVNKQSFICVLEVSILSLSTIIIFDFGIVPTAWYFFFFSFYLIKWLFNLFSLSVPGKYYSRNTLCALIRYLRYYFR